MFFPVVLGTGKRLFEDGFPFETLEVEEFRQVGPDGVFIVILKRKG
jgi:hypothetical protein